ncbi:MAG TPA: rhodanese-like domain-containing protein [Mucilaginibacter sp.]|jgi:rhodanese-related sulfurtransferase
MKTKILTILICSIFWLTAKAQLNQRFDNSDYKAIYFKEACELMANNPNLILLDVRSPGEYADTSKYITARIGRLKGAINISIDSIDAHAKQLETYKGKTILVYCSHSQRSRVVSKALADDGFKNVYSLNGGMTEVNKTPDAAFPCKSSLYTSGLPYKLMGPEDAFAFVKDKNNVVIDVRPAADFNNTDSAEYANVGRIKDAINVPLSTLDKELPNLAKYKDRPVLVYELFTQDAMQAALKLTGAGFKNVSVLFEGYNTFLINTPSSSKLREELVASTPAYKIIGVRETVDLVNNTPGLVIADMRTPMEFKNMSSNNFSNLGHIKNAINFSVADLEAYLKDKPKSTPVLLYGAFSSSMKGMKGMTDVDLGSLCKKLTSEGYSNVYLLYNGLYSVVWASGNTESCKDAKSILTDHQNLY